MTVKGKSAGNSARFIFVFLGLLTAFGPFVTDMYLPSLPVMTAYFDTSVSMVQTGLTFSMLGLVFGQLVFGPLSDAYGRRRRFSFRWFCLLPRLLPAFLPRRLRFLRLCAFCRESLLREES